MYQGFDAPSLAPRSSYTLLSSVSQSFSNHSQLRWSFHRMVNTFNSKLAFFRYFHSYSHSHYILMRMQSYISQVLLDNRICNLINHINSMAIYPINPITSWSVKVKALCIYLFLDLSFILCFYVFTLLRFCITWSMSSLLDGSYIA